MKHKYLGKRKLARVVIDCMPFYWLPQDWAINDYCKYHGDEWIRVVGHSVKYEFNLTDCGTTLIMVRFLWDEDKFKWVEEDRVIVRGAFYE